MGEQSIPGHLFHPCNSPGTRLGRGLCMPSSPVLLHGCFLVSTLFHPYILSTWVLPLTCPDSQRSGCLVKVSKLAALGGLVRDRGEGIFHKM